MTNILNKILNYMTAMTKYAVHGFPNVSADVYNDRVAICESCPLNVDDECGLCGCPIAKKALWATESCPDKKWLAKEKKPEASTSTASSPYQLQKPEKKQCKKCQRK